MKKVKKLGISLVALIVTIVVLVILTGTVMLSIVGEEGIIDSTESVVDAYNKKVKLDEIKTQIQAAKLRKLSQTGQNTELTKAEIIQIMSNFGTYDENTMKITTEEGIQISLLEVETEIVNDYVEVSTEGGVLSIETQLPVTDYVIEYSINGGQTWSKYTSTVAITEGADVKVRVTNTRGEVVSKPDSIVVGEEQANLVSIAAVMNKTTYIAGETISKSDITVTATYDNGKTETITSYTYSPEGTLAVGNNSVTISYTENGITQTITKAIVVTNNITGITVTKAPDKTTYNHGETFNKTGMIVTLNYQNINDSRALEATEYTVSTPTYRQNYVTITHTETGMTTTQAITVNKPTLGSQIDEENYGQAVNYSVTVTDEEEGTTTTHMDWQIYYKGTVDGTEYVYLIKSNPTGSVGWQKTNPDVSLVDVVNASTEEGTPGYIYNIMKLGQPGYTLNSESGSAATADLIVNYGDYANTSGYKDVNGNSYIVGSIGGPTLELLNARTGGLVTVETSEGGYTYWGKVSTGLPASNLIWLSAPMHVSLPQSPNGYITELYSASSNLVDYTPITMSDLPICPVVCLKSSIPALWNETDKIWEIGN